jgi:hypothetical protein
MLIMAVVPASADTLLTPIGGPQPSQSWEQRFSEGPLAFTSMSFVSDVAIFPTDEARLRDFSQGQWDVTGTDGTSVTATLNPASSIDPAEPVLFTVTFAGDLGSSVAFTFNAYNGEPSAGTSVDCAYVSYDSVNGWQGVGDVAVVVPLPSTAAGAICGLGLLALAARKRQSGSCAT